MALQVQVLWFWYLGGGYICLPFHYKHKSSGLQDLAGKALPNDSPGWVSARLETNDSIFICYINGLPSQSNQPRVNINSGWHNQYPVIKSPSESHKIMKPPNESHKIIKSQNRRFEQVAIWWESHSQWIWLNKNTSPRRIFSPFSLHHFMAGSFWGREIWSRNTYRYGSTWLCSWLIWWPRKSYHWIGLRENLQSTGNLFFYHQI